MQSIKRDLLTVGTIALVLLLTNPSPEAHREAARERIAEKSSIIDALIGGTATKAIRRENYYICSIGVVADKPVTIGVLGFVYARPWSE